MVLSRRSFSDTKYKVSEIPELKNFGRLFSPLSGGSYTFNVPLLPRPPSYKGPPVREKWCTTQTSFVPAFPLTSSRGRVVCVSTLFKLQSVLVCRVRLLDFWFRIGQKIPNSFRHDLAFRSGVSVRSSVILVSHHGKT